MRYLAHVNNLSLGFCSIKNAVIAGQLRNMINDIMFEDKPKIVSQKDHLKPIYIYRNQDSLANIAVPSTGSLSGL